MGRTVDYIAFTDGSVRTIHNRITYAGFGVVLYNTTTKQYASFGGELGSRTIAFAELWAIHSAMSALIDRAPEGSSALILTDSKLCVTSINEYMTNWIRSADSNGIWYGVSKDPVKNQETYKLILHQLKGPVHFKVSHINSHLSVRKQHDLDQIKDKLEEYGIKADDKTASAVIEMNSLADTIASGYSGDLVELDRRHHFQRLRPLDTYY